MYKIVLVESERIILEGIAAVIEWENLDAVLVGKAQNAKDAIKIIEQVQPHIVITDLNLPDMSGLAWIHQIKRALKKQLQIISMIKQSDLSNEEVTPDDMDYVILNHHYEDQLLKSLKESLVKCKKMKQQASCSIFQLMDSKMRHKIVPKLKEQFLRDSITNRTMGVDEWNYYGELLSINTSDLIRCLVFEIERGVSYIHRYALLNIASECIERAGGTVLLYTALDDKVILVIDSPSLIQLRSCLVEIIEVYLRFFKLRCMVLVSLEDRMHQVAKLYNEVKHLRSLRFYLGMRCILVSDEIPLNNGNICLGYYEKLIEAVQNRNWPIFLKTMKIWTRKLRKNMPEIDRTKEKLQQVFTYLVKRTNTDIDVFAEHLVEFRRCKTLEQIYEYFRFYCETIIGKEKNEIDKFQFQIVKKALEYINKNLSDPNLSLSKIAQEALYLNPDYFGKLFKKEIGENFSNYVNKVRMKKAVDLMKYSYGEVKVLDIAEKVGFAENASYFSLVFKKYTGLSPTEFKKQVIDQSPVEMF
jgi:two-component system response regulator YesN